MGSTSSTGSFGGRVDLDGMWQAMDELRAGLEKRLGEFGPSRASGQGSRSDAQGDLRSAILALLAEKPMHGYQLIGEIEERSDGSMTPSAGDVYPTLQLLTDEGLIVAVESDGRKVHSLTEAGRAVADAADDLPWGDPTTSRDRRSALPKAAIGLARATAQVGRSGSSEQVDQAVVVLEEARRRLYSILAQD
ncbi:PadR family transcriptional regulator [Frigoribacterium sp. 2-23]|uniref:PadR family transcriptional regulator n=1 Tax=Frigoribacterium sp. 2-23 TaxID=3415006 RepID=UPI003C6F8143